MRFLFSALLLIFIPSSHEIDASGKAKKILTGRKSPQENKDRIDLLATPRVHRSSSLRYNSTSVAQKALNLNEYYPHVLESSHQPSSTEVSDLVEKFRFQNAPPPQIAASSSMIQNDEYHDQSSGYGQEYPQENTRWLIEHYRRGTLPIPQAVFEDPRQHLDHDHEKEPVNVPLVRRITKERTGNEQLGKYYTGGDDSGKAKKNLTGRKSSHENKDGMDLLATPRVHRSSSLRYNSTSVPQEALNLNKYHPHVLESSHQPSSTEISEMMEKFKFRNVHPPRIDSSSSTIQNDESQHQSSEYGQEYPLENTRWLIEQYRRGILPIPEAVPIDSRQHLDDENEKEPVNVPAVRRRAKKLTGNKPLVKYHTGEDARMLRAELAKLRSLYGPPREKVQQRTSRKSEIYNFKQFLRNKDPSDANYSSDKPPPTSLEIDKSKTPGDLQKGKAVIEKSTRWKKIPPPDELISEESQLSKMALEDDQPEFITNDMSRFNNPYHEYQRQVPKSDHNPHYH